MRVFKTKPFARFQRRERLTDEALVKAVRGAEIGLIDADMGHGLVKQRVARPGQGKSGGYRTVIAYRKGDLAVFLLGFAKSERANVEADELAMLRGQALSLLGLSLAQIEEAVAVNELIEVSYDEED